jgi:SAM-dependent methyltransferase
MDIREYQVMARVEETHPWFVNRRRLVRGLVARYARHLAAPRLLDAGSGTGVNLADYATLGHSVGVELDREAAIISVRRGNERVAVGDLCRLPFPDARFDIVISTDVIEHIDDDVAALREMRRVLSCDGRIVLTTPAYSRAYSSHDRFLHHVRRYDHDRLQSAIDGAGLQVLHRSRYNVLLAGPLVLARWLGDRFGGREPNGSDVGRPVPRIVAPVLGAIWRAEAFLSERVNLRVGLTHVAVLARTESAA